MDKPYNDTDEAINGAINCYGTARVLEKRITRIERINQMLIILEILTPICILGFAAVDSISKEFTDELKEQLKNIPQAIKTIYILVVFILCLIQTFISRYSRASKLNEKLEIYTASRKENDEIAKEYIIIYKRYDEDEEKYAKQLEKINEANKAQLIKDYDNKIIITEKEKRYGKRSALLQYGAPCSVCGKMPDASKTKPPCQDCGN